MVYLTRKVTKSQPFFLEAIRCIEDRHYKPKTMKASAFKHQVDILREYKKNIAKKKTKSSEKAQYRAVLMDLFEKTLRTLICAEAAFWNQKFLTYKMQDLYQRKVFLEHINMESSESPKLIFESMISADRKLPRGKVSSFIYGIYKMMMWSDTTVLRIQQLEMLSLKNVTIIKAIELSVGDEMKMLESKFLHMLENRK